MTSRDFVYWLQGFMEITDAAVPDRVMLSGNQIDCIRKHLDMVFVHEIDPSFGDKKHQEKLAEAHKGTMTITGIPDSRGPLMNC